MGCGIDVVDVPRFERTLTRGGRAFLQRVFTAREVAYADARPRTRALHLAARFAAKEAVIKALAHLGSDGAPAMTAIEVVNDRVGRPHVRLHGRRHGSMQVQVSLSHVQSVAVASAFAIR
jgi:holo-[acyl-carrier protein] synthase